MSVPILTIVNIIHQKQLLTGYAYGGSRVHIWRDKANTFCGKSGLTRRGGRSHLLNDRLCPGCRAEVEKLIPKEGAK